ncbi:MAG: hypothetical protein MR936_10970 [Eubacterium sp.]|nr:hypothetical protein [Eubacterium sp.]
MRKRSTVLLLAGLLTLSGCGKIEKVAESTVTVDKKGIVTEILIEDFSSEEYQEDELKKSIEELVSTYNEQAGEEEVTLKKMQVKDGNASVLMQYSTDDAYRAFNQVDFFAGTVKQAGKEGYAFAGAFTDAKGQAVSQGTIPAECQDHSVIIIREPLAVLVPGKILYVSKNMKILGEDCARLAADSEDTYENAQVTTEAYGYVIYSAE